MLASFRPTWRQAIARGLAAAVLLVAAGILAAGSLALVGAPPADPAGGRSTRPTRPGPAGLLGLGAAPPGLGLLVVLATRRWATVRLDSSGLRTVEAGPAAFVPWDRVTDIRAERRHRRTVVQVYLADGAARRLRAPYDGRLLGRDPRFERKLFLINHLWETHRNWSIPGRAPAGPTVA